MRLGIRLQLLLALGSLLVLAFVPLFFAVASLTRATMASVRETSAHALGRVIAARANDATSMPPDAMPQLLGAQLGPDGAAAIAIYDPRGARVELETEPGFDAASVVPEKVTPGIEQQMKVETPRGPVLMILEPGPAKSSAIALMRVDVATTPVTPLVRLVALYTGVVGLALLAFAYIAMTRLVVRPVDRLSRAAGQVANGARALDVPRSGAAELVDLGSSLARMTENLKREEEQLRAKIAELERTTKDLAAAQERLVRSERLASVGRLAAGLAHEIGNPIAAILGFQELLLDGGLDAEEERDFLRRMKKETERVHKILRDLLDFARPAVQAAKRGDSMHPPPSSASAESGSVKDAVTDVEALVAPQKGFKEIALEIDLAPDLPRVAMATSKLVQVLLNLLLNASEVVPSSGGRIAVRAARAGEGLVRVEVEDNGPGVPQAVKGRLFEPFVTTKDVGKGTGLGLAVCRGLLEAAGGSIALAESEGGARFVLEIPAAK